MKPGRFLIARPARLALQLAAALSLAAGTANATGVLLAEGAERMQLVDTAALVIHRDETEIFIADPTFEAAGAEAGTKCVWLVLVPPATAVETAPSGIVESARMLFTPDVRELGRPPDESFFSVWFLSLVLLPLAFTATGRILDLEISARHALGIGIATIAGSIVAFAIAHPGLAVLEGATEPLTPQASGVREPHPLRAPVRPADATRLATPEELDRWLAAGGFSPPPETLRNGFARIAADGWECLALRVETSRARRISPGPLMLRFPAKRPLTLPVFAKGGASPPAAVGADLTVIADTPVGVGALETVLRDRFLPAEIPDAATGGAGAKRRVARSESYDITIAHPELAGWIGDSGRGAWVTRATAEAADLSESMKINEEPATPSRKVVCGITVAANRAALPAVWTLVLLPPLAALALRGRTYRRRWIWLAAVLLAPVAAGVRAMPMEIVRIHGPRYRNLVRLSCDRPADLPVRALREILRRHTRDSPLPLESVAVEGIEAELDRIIPRRFVNPLTRLPVALSDTPGNYRWSESAAGAPVMIVRDHHGAPHEFEIEELLKNEIEAANRRTNWRNRR